MINNIKKVGKRKIQLTIKPEFMLSTDSNEKRMLHIKSDNVEIMIDNDTDKIIQELFNSFLWRGEVFYLAMLMGYITRAIR